MNSRTDGSPLTASVSVLVTKDGGAQTASAGTLSHEGNGHWNYAPTQGETDAAHVAFTFTHATGVNQTVQTYPVSFDPTDATALGLSRLDATVGSRATQASVDTVDDFLDTEITDIRNRLPAALVGGRMDASVGAYQAGQAPLQPTVAGRTLDVSATGEADANVVLWLGAAVNALLAGRIDANAQVIGTDAVNALALNLDAVQEIADGVFDRSPFAEGLTFRQWARLIAAACLGKSDSFPAGPIHYRDLADTKNRITATVDADGNRSAVVLDGT